MSVLTYACRIEIEPGITVPVERCSAEHLARAHALQARREGLLVEVRHLIEEAARYDLTIPDELREALALWSDDVPALEELVGALTDCLAPQPV
jgi:hypothetical protein